MILTLIQDTRLISVCVNITVCFKDPGKDEEDKSKLITDELL